MLKDVKTMNNLNLTGFKRLSGLHTNNYQLFPGSQETR